MVRRSLEGEKTAFAELYRRRARLVIACCQDTTRDLHGAADLTQEVFLRAYSNLERLEHPDRFGLWVLGIARRVCQEWLRRRGRQSKRLQDYAQSLRSPSISDPEELRRELLLVAIAKLPERERIALHAFYLEDLNIKAVTDLLGMTRPSAYRLLSRARQNLKCLLEELEVSP